MQSLGAFYDGKLKCMIDKEREKHYIQHKYINIITGSGTSLGIIPPENT